MGGGGYRGWVGLGLSAVLLSGQAFAQGQDVIPPEGEAKPSASTVTAGGFTFTPGGRFIADVGADERQQFKRDLDIDSARLGVHAEYRMLDAVLEAELASPRNPLRDAFVRMSTEQKGLRFSAGQYKAPFLQRELLSNWRLPLTDRGLVHEYLADQHGLGGRRLGAMVELRAVGKGKLRTYAGVFEGSENELGETLGEDVALRSTYKISKGFTVGASGYAAEAFVGAKRYALAADAQFRFKGLTLSSEVVGAQLATGRALGAMALLGYELPLDEQSLWRLRPVLGAESLALTGQVRGQGFSATAGMGVLYGQQFRAMAQVERAHRPADERPQSAVTVSVGTRF